MVMVVVVAVVVVVDVVCCFCFWVLLPGCSRPLASSRLWEAPFFGQSMVIRVTKESHIR